jgi:hypothetical protein
MSNGLAIAAITAILKNILEDGLALNSVLSSLGNILVTTSPPDQISISAEGQPQLNLFLYQVSQNRNADGMGRNHPGQTLGENNPPLAINLHYILTAYASQDFQTELLLGYAMEFMQEKPVLSNDTIRASLNHIATIHRTGLLSQAIASTSVTTLAEQLGQVQITPTLFDTEQMSRLWSLLHGSYRPSIAYEVSTVFIGPQTPASESNPCLVEIDQPYINRIVPAPSTIGEIIAGSHLIVYGKNLSGDVNWLCLNEEKPWVEPQIVEDNRILFQLPESISVGVQHLQVIHQQMYQSQTHSDVVSNGINFVVYPSIKFFDEAIENYSQERTKQDSGEESDHAKDTFI